jgi:DNA-binding transcriptional LysR family regulator
VNRPALALPERIATVQTMHIEFRQLRQFLAVVELKSFTAAAEKLHMTQPALTRSVQQLEERFNVKLIDRASKTFELTPFGRILAERARLIEQEFAHIDSEIIALKSGETGRLRVGTGPSGIGYLPAAVADFQQQRPNVDVQLIVDSMDANVAALLNGDLDLICTALEFPRHPTLVCERILEIGNVIIAAKSHLLADRATVEPRDLLQHPWVGFVNDEMARTRLGGYFAANALDMPRFAVQTNNLETLFALLATSDYLASVPSLVLPDARARGLVALKVKGSFWSIGLGYAHLRTSQVPPALKTFLSILRTHILMIESDNPRILDT